MKSNQQASFNWIHTPFAHFSAFCCELKTFNRFNFLANKSFTQSQPNGCKRASASKRTRKKEYQVIVAASCSQFYWANDCILSNYFDNSFASLVLNKCEFVCKCTKWDATSRLQTKTATRYLVQPPKASRWIWQNGESFDSFSHISPHVVPRLSVCHTIHSASRSPEPLLHEYVAFFDFLAVCWASVDSYFAA